MSFSFYISEQEANIVNSETSVFVSYIVTQGNSSRYTIGEAELADHL